MSDPDLVLLGTKQTERGNVATVIVNNPAKANCFGRATMQAFIERLGSLHDSFELRAVVITGSGERAFIGGADVREMAVLEPDEARRFITLVHQCCAAVRNLPVPVIAQINGAVLGAGLELAASCDFRIAAEHAVFGMPEVRLGMPSVVEAALLPQLIGWGKTRRLLLTGETIDAAQAERWGLVEEVVPLAELDQATDRAVDGILAAGSRAVRLQKRLIQTWETQSIDGAIRAGIDCFAEAWSSDEPRRMTAGYLRRRR
ncbi:MAG TPA: enoyl-CoA hydratase [Candidatus Sulfotelmatobacter sp.]|nr:enoyl-CoA hydratase [Candidatus Sulfotelmatobacter sp.]